MSITTHPSDMCVAPAALGALVDLEGVGGARTLPQTDLHRLPGELAVRTITSVLGELLGGRA